MIRHRMTAAVGAIALVGGLLAASTTASAAGGNSRATLAGSHPGWAKQSAKTSNAPKGEKLDVRVYLPLRDQAQAEATALAVSDPSSPSFHHFLTADQVRQRFAPTQATVNQVSSWLSSSHFQVTSVPANNQYVEAIGTVGDAESAFGVTLSRYRVDGGELRAPDGDLSIPASIAGSVAGVIGVDQSMYLMAPKSQKPSPPSAGFRNAQPCSQYWGQKMDTTDPAYGGGFPNPLPYAPCGYTPPQLRSASGIASAVDSGQLTGAGQTVAIVDAFASPTILSDAQQYAKRNDPAHPLSSNQFSQIVFPNNPALARPEKCDASGWYGEETLDVEAVHGMAPGANILYVGGADCRDMPLDKAVNEIVSRHLANIVSNSYGELGEDLPAHVIRAFQSIATQADLEGIGLYFSSGDSGDESGNLPKPETDFSADSPLVTAVGGTSLGIGASGQKVIETGWETGKSVLVDGTYKPPAPGAYLYGSGGGFSHVFAEPSYQQGRLGAGFEGKGRAVPDISMDGDPNTGMLIGQTQVFPEGTSYGEFRIGGTSLSSPLFAGVMALADQSAGSPHGFINPVLYGKLRNTSAITDVVHRNGAVVRVDYLNGTDAADGTATSVRTFDFPGLSIHTGPGYDTTTGLGTPNGLAFVKGI